MPSAAVSAPVPSALQNLPSSTRPSPAIQNALDFVRALKAPTDPPHLPGPYKIEIAQAAWDNDSFYMPNKAETIAEWALVRLLKDKAKDSATNAIFDIQYWILLENVLFTHPGVQIRDKAWLAPLLSRIPIAPIVVTLYSRQVHEGLPALEPHACRCLSALWPLAVPKFSSEALLECFGTMLDYFSARNMADRAASEGFLTLGSLIVSSYRSTLVNSSNRKKLYASFVQTHLQSWLQWTAEESSVSVVQESYDAGVETLFHVEALRSFQDQHAASTLETALANIASTRPDIVLKSLSRLFISHGEAQMKHRAALYGQGSKQATGSTTEHARSAIMAFFTLCESLLSLVPDSAEVWKARVSLLRLVDQKGLLSRMDESSAGVLRTIGDACITTLASVKQGNREAADAILTALETITHIDYDLVPFSLSRVLPILAQAPFRSMASDAYLQQLLDYHTKARTMDTYVMSSLQAFTTLPPSANIQVLYADCSAGPLLGRVHLDSLSRSVRSYLTPGQVLETTQSVMQHMTTLLRDWRSFQTGDSNERPSKKRKIIDNSPESSALAAVRFMLSTRSAAVILTSLPLRSLLPDGQQGVQDMIHDTLEQFTSHLRSVLKAVEKNGKDTWGSQVIITAILRLRYSLTTTADLHLSFGNADKLLDKMLSCLKSSHITSELRVEIIRSLLFEVSQGRCDAVPVFDETLACIDKDGSPQKAGWTGELHELGNRDSARVAVFYLLCERWLPFFHQLASDDQIARLVTYMLKLCGTVRAGSDLTSLTNDDVFQRVLHDAHFWELNRLRDALLELVSTETLPLDNISQDDLWTTSRAGKRNPRLPLEASHLRRMFEIILITPQECLSRETRANLLRRAFVADVALTKEESPLADDHLTLLLYLREFIRRTVSQSGEEHLATIPYVLHLVQSLGQVPDSGSRVTFLTQELIKTHISAVITEATRQKTFDLLSLLKFFLDNLKLTAERQAMERHRQVSLTIMISLLVTEHKPTQFTDDTLQSIRRLQDQLFLFVLPRISTQTASDGQTLEPELLDVWWRLLALRRWLGVDASQTPLVVIKVASKVRSRPKAAKASECTAILAIALEELHLSRPNRPDQLDFVVAAYMLFSRHREVQSSLHEVMSQASRTLAVSDYDDVLDTIVNGLRDGRVSAGDLSSLIHLLGLMLHASPEGSLKVVQKHTVQCLGVFVNRQIFIDDTSLAFSALHLMANHFNDRPAAIRSIEVSTAWTFIGHCLVGSRTHTPKTNRAIYREIVAVLSVLIRLRRDLVMPVLPLLGLTLHKLVLLLRTLAPNLGATQSELVSRTLPQWVNATDPMTAEESKALARLLTMLTTKSIIRTHTNAHTEVQKADSLVRPFSKHAAHVLSAYLSALNDPLCVMSSAIRKELEPGLFALCDVMGEQNRDALMVALSAGEMAVMKGVWRAYEKQRYVGKG